MALVRMGGKKARRLRERARMESGEVEAYLAKNASEWEQIAREDPPDAADIVEEVKDDAALGLIRGLKTEDAADVLEEMRPDLAAELMAELAAEDAATLLSQMSTQRAADVLGEMSEDPRRAVLAKLAPHQAVEIEGLLAYPKDSAGGMMSTRVAAFAPDERVSEVIERLRVERERLEDKSTLFVVGPGRALIGTVAFKELVFARPDTALEELMAREPAALTPLADRERAAELARRYNLDSVPVTDAQGRLLGALNRAAVLETVQEEAAEDFAVASGAGKEETIFTRVLRSVRMRLPWLLGNLLMALGVVFAVERQKGIIDSNAVLAALMPLVAQVGGNGGAQSLAVVIRALATDALSSQKVLGIVGRQLTIGLLNGLMVGIAAGVIGTVIGGARIGVVVALGALVNLTVGSASGSAIPIILRRVGLDPALASNIFLTLITDLVGFGGFLLIATLLL